MVTQPRPPAGVEIETVEELDRALAEGVSPGRLRLQDLDLRGYRGLDARMDLGELVVLGGVVPPDLDAHLRRHGAIVFPNDPDAAPIRPYRARLYTADELYSGLAAGYAATPDAQAYAWYQDGRTHPDVFAALLQAIHDDSISDALGEFVDDQQVVGVMGGHALARGTRPYAEAARLGFALAERGFLVTTGGGPGAMEAANLGAAAPDPDALGRALGIVGEVPTFADLTAWARTGFAARSALGEVSAPGARSLGIPTWFYGHEPPNVFAQGIAKYFSNAIREDWLLAHANAGVVVLPGAAGTVQEIFQVATRAYYADGVPAPLVLVGVEHWTRGIPAWPALEALGRGRAMGERIALVEHVDDAIAQLAER